jgi:hypothetical protein
MAAARQPKSSTETLDSKLKENGYRDNRSDVESFGVLVAAERENEIKYRTWSWQKVRIFALV